MKYKKDKSRVITVRMEEYLYGALADQADRCGATISEMVRDILYYNYKDSYNLEVYRNGED